MSRIVVVSLTALALCLAAGCSQQVDEPVPTSESAEALSMQQVEGGVVGTFVTDTFEVSFSSKMVEQNVADIVLRFNEMTVTALVDLETGVMEYDGYASENGEDTQITAEDRATLLAFTRALDTLGQDVDQTVSLMRRFTSVWSEFPDSLDPQRQAFAEKDKSYVSLCGHCGSYVRATHDCWWKWRGDDDTTYYAHVSMIPEQCGGHDDGARFWNGSAWNNCDEPDHSKSIEYAYGNCFGRCGSGCGSDSQMTLDCLDHDSCVRFGHDVASLWCDDEFTYTADDWLNAPNCGSSCGL